MIPDHARVLFFFDHFEPEDRRLELIKEGDRAGVFATRIEPGRIQRSFRFQVLAGDNETEQYLVNVLPPPDLDLLDGHPSPQLRLHFPAYTDLPSPQVQAPGNGNIEAVLGTFVEFRAAANRPLRQAWLEYVPEQPLTPLSAFLAPLGATSTAGVLALTAAGRDAWDRVPARLDEKTHRLIAIDFMPRLTGNYVLHFEDENNLHNSRIFELRLRPDPPPTVTLERPSQTRDILSMLPTADVRIQVIAEDPQFAVRSRLPALPHPSGRRRCRCHGTTPAVPLRTRGSTATAAPRRARARGPRLEVAQAPARPPRFAANPLAQDHSLPRRLSAPGRRRGRAPGLRR